MIVAMSVLVTNAGSQRAQRLPGSTLSRQHGSHSYDRLQVYHACCIETVQLYQRFAVIQRFLGLLVLAIYKCKLKEPLIRCGIRPLSSTNSFCHFLLCELLQGF